MKTTVQIVTWCHAHPNELIILSMGEDGMALDAPMLSMGGKVIASWGGHWDHVSVSGTIGCPTWGEMDLIKSIFWNENEVVMQLHVNDGRKTNHHPYCLHMWKPQKRAIPLPPKNYV